MVVCQINFHVLKVGKAVTVLFLLVLHLLQEHKFLFIDDLFVMLVFKGVFVAHLDLMVLSLAFGFFTIEASLEYVDLVLDQV